MADYRDEIGNQINDAVFALAFFSRPQDRELPGLPQTHENVFAKLRVARIIFESQMANDAAP